MAKLPDTIKTFIVQHLAMFDTPSQVAEAVKEEFKVEVTRQLVESYNPERAGEKPAKKWVQLHAATRKAFLDEVAAVPTAHKAVRLRRLDRMATKAEQKGNMVLAKELLEQIAKECGDAFTNKRKLVGGNQTEGDSPISHEFVFEPDVPPPIGVKPSAEDDD